MPYQSEKQRRFMHSQHPGIAARWDKEQKRDDRKSAAVGAGATVGTVGAVGGGVPGMKAGRLVEDINRAPIRKKPGTTASAFRAGAFGYRANAHNTYTNFELSGNKHPGKSRVAHFLRARDAGKLPPEKIIIRHMNRARRASNVALVGGAGLTAYGLTRKKREQVTKAQRDTRRRDVAVTAGGGTFAVGSAGGASLAEHLGNRWSKRSMHNLEEARKIVPNLGGYDIRRGHSAVPDIKPKYNSHDIIANPKILAGKSKAQASRAARFHGAAAQQRHFADVYGQTGKYLRRIAVPVGVGAAALGGASMLRNRRPAMEGGQAGHGRKVVRKSDDIPAMGEYQYLLPTIRQQVEWGIPEERRNPVSPLQMVAAANIAGAGYTEVKRHWPIGKKKRRERGMLKLGIAQQLGNQPFGFGVGS